MIPLALLQLGSFLGEADALTGQLLHGLCMLGLLMVVFLGFRAFVDSRINRIQLHLTQALARYMQDADAKRQQLEAHAEQLLEQHNRGCIDSTSGRHLARRTQDPNLWEHGYCYWSYGGPLHEDDPGVCED